MVCLRGQPQRTACKPCALLELAAPKYARSRGQGKAPIIALTPAAALAGVQVGMTATQGQARCPDLILLNRSPEAEDEAQRLLLDAADGISPDYEETGAGVVTLNLLGVKPAQHIPLCERALGELAEQGLPARAGIAANPDLARLSAELTSAEAPVRAVEGTPEAIRAFLEPLPIGALHPSAELAGILKLWGIRDVRGYLALPLAEISERLGLEGVALYRMAKGGANRLLRLVHPTAVYMESHEFEYEVEQLDQLLFLLRLFLEKILARLASVSLAAGELRLRLSMRHGGLHERDFRIPEPCCDLDVLLRILETHLETVTTPEPVVGMALQAIPARRGQHQPDFFEKGLRDPNRLAETLARLEALLGAGRVGRPVLLDRHQPDAFKVVNFMENSAPAQPIRESRPVYTVPLRRFRPPIPARIQHDSSIPGRKIPIYVEAGEVRGRIIDCRGPWPTSGNWWDEGAWKREEWNIQLVGGALYRLAYHGASGSWTLEGYYA